MRLAAAALATVAAWVRPSSIFASPALSRAIDHGASSLVGAPDVAFFASATCAPASKPGRIRCRATIELPLDAVATRRIGWAELLVVSADTGVVPLRGRLGPLDAETRDDGRVAWSFSVAAASAGERTLRVSLRATLENKEGGAGTPVERVLAVAVKVAP